MKHILVLLLAIGCDSPEKRAAELAQYNEKKKGKIEQNVAKATPEERAAIARYKEKRRLEEERAAEPKKKSLDPSLMKQILQSRQVIKREFDKGCDASDSLLFKKTHKWYVSMDGRNWRHIEVVFRNRHENIVRALDSWGEGTVYPAKARDFARHLGACR